MNTIEKLDFTFDPFKSDNPTIRAVFADDLAQVIWCAIKRNHIVNQYFNANCLALADELRKKKWVNITGQQLNWWLKDMHIIGSAEEDVGDKVLPYIKKEIIFEYVINKV